MRNKWAMGLKWANCKAPGPCMDWLWTVCTILERYVFIPWVPHVDCMGHVGQLLTVNCKRHLVTSWTVLRWLRLLTMNLDWQEMSLPFKLIQNQQNILAVSYRSCSWKYGDCFLQTLSFSVSFFLAQTASDVYFLFVAFLKWSPSLCHVTLSLILVTVPHLCLMRPLLKTGVCVQPMLD